MAAAAQTATFGAGCFWGTEKFFRKQFGPALLSAQVGYLGGTTPNPTYEDVCSGQTGHAEVLQIQYDPSKATYEALVEYFFRMHNPTTLNQQGNDTGTQYRSAIFYHNDEQAIVAKAVRDRLQATKIKAPIVTVITPATTFYPVRAGSGSVRWQRSWLLTGTDGTVLLLLLLGGGAEGGRPGCAQAEAYHQNCTCALLQRGCGRGRGAPRPR